MLIQYIFFSILQKTTIPKVMSSDTFYITVKIFAQLNGYYLFFMHKLVQSLKRIYQKSTLKMSQKDTAQSSLDHL
jgi:hypothetical protein